MPRICCLKREGKKGKKEGGEVVIIIWVVLPRWFQEAQMKIHCSWSKHSTDNMFHALPCGPKPKLSDRFSSPKTRKAYAVQALWAEILLLIQKHHFPVPCTFFRFSHAVLQQVLGMVCKARCLLYKMNPKNWFFLSSWSKCLFHILNLSR